MLLRGVFEPRRFLDLLQHFIVFEEDTDSDRLRELLQVASGGVVFTTIQKFMPDKGEKMPELSPRRNIVVIADETHRSQYDLIDGLARNASTLISGHRPSVILTCFPLQFVATRNVRVRLPALGQKPHKIRSRSIHPSLAASLWSRVSENVTIAIFRDKTDTKSLKSRSGFAVCP